MILQIPPLQFTTAWDQKFSTMWFLPTQKPYGDSRNEEIWPDFKGFSGISLVEASHIFPWQGNANCNLFVKPPGPGQANNICYKSTWEVHLREFCISAQLTAFCETWLELYLTTPLGLVVAASYRQTAQLTAVSPNQIGDPLCTYQWVESRTSLISIYTHVYEYKAI